MMNSVGRLEQQIFNLRVNYPKYYESCCDHRSTRHVCTDPQNQQHRFIVAIQVSKKRNFYSALWAWLSAPAYPRAINLGKIHSPYSVVVSLERCILSNVLQSLDILLTP